MKQPSSLIVAPRAPALVEALRAVGYSLETAVADLLDNSITATAKRIWVDFHWNGEGSWIRIIDDGRGMTSDELTEAMRPGTRNPLEERAQGDLGRFGLGLKTASFSQARRLSVASRRDGIVSVRCWDLDHIGTTGEWHLWLSAPPETAALLELPPGNANGTVVVWEKLDRVVGKKRVDDRDAHNHFLRRIDSVREHLEMVFHRYLEGEALKIFVNGRTEGHRIEGWDPFIRWHQSTLPTPAESIGQVKVQGFVLPHRDRFEGEEAARKAGGPAGWSAQQGFYIYRHRRMLVAGGWLDLGYQNEEHYKLARISVEIPNTLDQAWNIDVKKSRARPPGELRQRLRDLADNTRKQAREVFVHRGKQQPRRASAEPLARPWAPHIHDGRQSYRIQRNHPLVKHVLAAASAEQRKSLEAMLRLVEETVPVQQIWLAVSETPETLAKPFGGEASPEVKKLMRTIYDAFRKTGTAEEARHRLRLMEPFDAFPTLIEALDD